MGRLAEQLNAAMASGVDQSSQTLTSKFAADPQGALRNPEFLALLRDYYLKRGKNMAAVMSDEALIDYFYSDRNWADLNTVSAVRDAGRALGADPETRQQMLEIQEVWQGLPNMFQEGGRGRGAVLDVAKALLFDPVNLLGGAIGKGVGQGAARTAAATGNMALQQAVRRGTLRGAGAAALSEGAINAGAEGVIDTALQARDVAIGLQDEFDLGRTGTAMGLGGLLGGVAGGAIAAPSAYAGARIGAEQADTLSRFTTGDGQRMFPAEEVAAMSNRGADNITRTPEALGEAVTARSTQFEALRAEEEAARVAQQEKETPPAPFLARALDQMRAEIDEMRADGVHTDVIEEASRRRAALARLVPFGERLENERKTIVALEASEDEGKRQLGKERRAQFEKDYDEFRALTKDGDEGDIKAAIERWNQQFQPGQAQEAPAAAQPATKPAAAPKAGEPAAEGAPQAAEAAAAPEAAAPVEPAAPEPTAPPREVVASDKVREAAEKAGIDITTLTGSGKGGRVVMGDVRRAAKAAKDAPAAEAPAAAAEVTPLNPDRPGVVEGKPTRAENVARTERAAQVSRQVRREAMAKGIDYAEAVELHPGLTPDAAVKRAMRDRFTANKAGEAIPQDARIGRIQDAINETMSLARTEKVTTIRELEQLIARAAASDRYADIGEDLVEYFDIIVSKASDAGSLYDDIADYGLNASEMKRLRRISKQIQSADPTVSKADADHRAARQLLAQRADDPTEGRDAARKFPSFGDRLERGAVFAFAGRNPDGKIQGFLRQSTPIAKGSDYGIGGDVSYPRRDRFDFEEAKIRAAKGEGRNGVFEFVASEPTLAKVPGKKNVVKVPAGMTLYTDGSPHRKFPYADEAQLRHSMPKGEGRGPNMFQVKSPKMPEDAEMVYPGGPKKADVELDIARGDAIVEGEMATTGERAAPRVEPTDDTRNAILIYSPSKGEFRMQSARQISDGTGIRGLLGKKAGGTTDWQVTFVPLHRKPSGTGKAAYRKLWDEFGADAKPLEEFDGDVRKAFAGDPFTPDGPPPLRWEEAESVMTDTLTPDDAAVINQALGQSRFKPGSTMSYGRLIDTIHELELKPWSEGSMQRVISGLKKLQDIAARTVREGHIGNVATRVEAHEDLNRVLARYTDEERAEVGRLVDRLSARNDIAPRFVASDEARTGFSANPARNMITVSRTLDDPKKSGLTPRMHILVHEIAHWAYQNILTPEDKAQFWTIMEAKYAGNRAAIDEARAIPGLSKSPKLHKIRETWDIPQELFADQFAMYWAKIDPQSTLRQEPFWQKITRYLKAIFDRYVSGKPIDPELEPIFARILPDEIEMEKFRTAEFGAEEVENRAQKVYRDYLAGLQVRQTALEDAILQGSPSGIINGHVEILQWLNAVAPRTRKSERIPDIADTGVDPKVLAPVRKLLPNIRNRQREIFEIFGMAKEDIPPVGMEVADEIAAFDAAMDSLENLANSPALAANMARQADIADLLGKVYTSGYADFTPEGGIPPKMTQTEFSSTFALLEMAHSAIQRAYMRVNPENLNKLPPGIMQPVSIKIAHKAGLTGQIITPAQREALIKTSRAKAKTEREVQDVVAKGWAAYDYMRSVDGDDSVAFANLNSLNEQKLYNRIKKSVDHGRPDYAAIYRLNEVLNARPLPKTPKAIPAGVKAMGGDQLERHLYDALIAGDQDYARGVAYEITRRARGGAKAGYKPVIKGKDAKFYHLIDTELTDFGGAPDRLGIPPSAGPDVRDFLGFLNHRSPEQTYATRKLAYRLLNLAGREERAPFEATSVSVGPKSVARLLGRLDHAVENVIDFRGEDFGRLRAELRNLAADLTKGSKSPDHVMKRAVAFALRAGVTDGENLGMLTRFFSRADDDGVERIAEELLPHLRGERSVEDTVNRLALSPDITDVEMDGVVNLVHDVREGTGYLLNGMIRREDIKDEYFPVTLYGGSYTDEAMPPFSDGVRRPAVSSELAVAYANDAYAGAPTARKSQINRFTGGGWGSSDTGYGSADVRPVNFFHGTPTGRSWNRVTNPDMMIEMSRDGNYGPGFYAASDPVPPGEVYASRGTPGALRRQFEEAHPDASDELIDEFEIEMVNLGDIRNALARARREYSMTAMADGDAEKMARLRQDIDNMIAQEETYSEILHDKFGIEFDPLVVPVYIRLLNPADFRMTSPVGDNQRFLAGLAADLVKRGNLTEENAARFIQSFIDDDPMSEAYQYLVELVAERARDYTAARSAITDSLRGLGYDGMLTTHRNTTSVDGGALARDGRAYASYQREYEVPVVFDRKNIKHVDAAYFDETDERIFYYPAPEDLVGATHSIMDGILSGKIDSIANVSPASVASLVERSASPRTGGLFMSLMRGRKLTGQERRSLEALSPRGWLKTQSQVMRDMGMNWLANRYEPVFQDITQDFAQRYMQVHNLLKALPDADGWFRAWTRRLNPTHSRHQPESFTKIVRALRRPSESKSGQRAYNALTAQEKEVYAKIRSLFVAERERLVRLGINMGNRGPDYYPQVWSVEAIVREPEKFKGALVEYRRIETEALGQEFDAVEAADFATKVYNRLADADQDGVVHPISAGQSRSPSAENIDYGRRIALDKPEHEAALKYLEPFMEDNLESVLTKYFDSTSRRAKLVDKFGVNAHGAYDYMEVAHEGAPAIARLLSTDKVFRRRSLVLGVDATPERDMTFETTIPMPFSGQRGRATDFAKELVSMFNGDGGSAGARAALEAIGKRNPETGRLPITYQRRIDAIMGALEDYGGKPANIGSDAHQFVERSLAVAMKKHQPGVSRRGARASSIIRSFNSVALLGFTTLTSIPDFALPMIRASSLREHAVALKKMASDPHYRQLIMNTGVAIENLMHDRMLYGFGAPDTKIASAFHNLTGLTPWTDVQRSIAGAVGVESFKAMQAKAISSYKPGIPLAQQSFGYRKAARFLTFYGLKEFLPDSVRAGESLSSEALLAADDQVRAAVIRFADHAIFAPNPNDVPLWTQTPVGALVFQLKSFPLLMMRMGRDVIAEAGHGNTAPLAKYLTLGPLFGMGALSVKDVVQARGGEENRESAMRERNWQTVANGLGFDVENEEAGHNIAGWYIDGLMAMGGLGLLGEVFYGIADQADNGAYGETRIVSLVGGPTAGTGLAAVKVFAGLTDNSESNAKERAAVREIATRVPIAGGVRKWREAAVDAVAGPQRARGGSEWGNGGDWDGGDWE